MRRSCGVLLPISALPSSYGIGTLGKAAYDFVDFLTEAGQSWWQLLPVGPTSYGDSPYQSFSTYAGNPYFVDLDLLVRDGLLKKEEIEARDWGRDPSRVDYAAIYRSRFQLLQIAADRGWERDADKVKAFSEKNAGWLPDYALFMALKRHFDMRAWTQWEDEDIRLRRPAAVERYQRELSEDIRLFTYIQYLFFRQWEALRTYAHKKGIGMIGDLPIYVAMDSADVWAEPDSFQLDERNIPKEVAGVPPDYFSEDGQLWGNPLYNWDAMKADGYGWWIRRVDGASRLYDILRIDHFRGLESYWAVPYGAENARVLAANPMQTWSFYTRCPLVMDHESILDTTWSFAQARAMRTVIAREDSGEYLILTVTNRTSPGLTLLQVVTFLQSRYDPLWIYNLDGGPSAALLAREADSEALQVLFGNTSRDADVMAFVELP